MDLDFALLADGVVEREGKLDIYGAGFDTIYAPAVPAVHARLVLAVRILLSRHEVTHQHRIDVVLQDADGTEIAHSMGEVPPMPEEQRAAIPAGRQIGLGLLLTFEQIVFPHRLRLAS
jgi:hypothetical protein